LNGGQADLQSAALPD